MRTTIIPYTIMISENVVEVKNVTKTFRISHEKRNTVFETILGTISNKNHFEQLTILEDVTFSIKKGEMVGIIGLNGSGKTTLLRIIAGIYHPNKGKVIRRGTTIPFLELGSGFQPDLTAKENIILYGMILGFTKKQIISKVDDIIKFAELENFADAKIKNFSSGMYARLAFATAIQVNPDILLVDEILSVGDLPFQRKSFEAFLSFKKKNKSIIFVSHNLETVRELCDRAIFIHNGRIHSIGKPDFVINAYKSIVDNMATIEILRSRADRSNKLSDDIDKDIFSLRPWYNDFSKLGINTGLEILSIPPNKNQKFIEPVIVSLLNKAFREYRNKKPSLLNMFCYDAYYSFYAMKTFGCERSVAIDYDFDQIKRAKLMSEKLNISNIDIRLQDIHTQDNNEQFDIVLNLNGLHMINDPERILQLTNKITKRFAIIQSVISLEKEDEEYFETPAPGWTWGCRFSEGKIKKWVESLDWKIIDYKKNTLEFNEDLKDRGCVYFLCEK